MKLPSLAAPAIHVAGDVGTSASKFFYRVNPGQTVPLWMGSEVADGLTIDVLPNLSSGGRPQDAAWVQIGDEVILVGDAAKACLDANSLAANKSEKAAYKIVAALGAIAELERLPGHYEANVWVPLPLTEIRTRDEIAAKLAAICEQGFVFRGQRQQVTIQPKFFPEGFGLYLNRKKQLDAIALPIEHRRTLILMMGHRNLSILCFEGGSLKVAASSSDGPGFWSSFEKTARSHGITPTDYPSLMAALTTGKTQQISQARAGVFEFGAIAESVRQTYWKTVSVYLQDHLLGQLTDESADLIISGGAASLLRLTIQDYCEDLGLARRFFFADGLQERLNGIVNALPEAATNPTLPMRMADCYGLFQGLLGKLNKVTV